MRRLALLILALSLLAVPATANAADNGGLRQLSGLKGCLTDETPTPSGCEDVRAMTNVGQIALSPDGSQLYVPSRASDAIIVFNRNPTTGALTQKDGVGGCLTSDAGVAAANECAGPPGIPAGALNGVSSVAVSPDGKNLYAAVPENSSLATINRAGSGELSFANNGPFIGQPSTVAVSPDNKSVYVGVRTNQGFLAHFTRNTTTGAVNFAPPCLTSNTSAYGCNFVAGIQDPSRLAVTPDNKQLLVANGETTACCAWTLLGFDRSTTSTPTGVLTAPDQSTCVTGNGGTPNCQVKQGMAWPRGLAVADGGRRIYVAAFDSLATITRDPATNTLTPDTSTGHCATFSTASFTGCTGIAPAANFDPTRDVAITPDGSSLYLGTESGTPSLFSMRRGSGGTFAMLPRPLGCLNPTAADNCGTLRAGGTIQSLAAAPGNRNVYAAGGNRLFSFTRDRAPVCQNVGANTAHNTAVTVTLSCSDPDGDGITYQKVGDPARGILGSVQGNHVSYNPFGGSSGSDSFTYRAVAANGARSDTATATVSVAGPPPGGGGGGCGGGTMPPPPPSLIPSTVTNNWLGFPKFTKVTQLSVNNLLAGTVVKVTCKTKKKKQQKRGCPYKSKRFTTSGARAKLNLRKPFKKKKMPIGTKITISVTVPGQIGKRFTYTMRKRAVPKKSLRCLPPGGGTASCA